MWVGGRQGLLQTWEWPRGLPQRRPPHTGPSGSGFVFVCKPLTTGRLVLQMIPAHFLNPKPSIVLGIQTVTFEPSWVVLFMTQSLERLQALRRDPKGKALFPGNICLKGPGPPRTVFKEAIKYTNGLHTPTWHFTSVSQNPQMLSLSNSPDHRAR